MTKGLFKWVILSAMLVAIISCEKDEQSTDQNSDGTGVYIGQGFTSFNTNGQTVLSTSINSTTRKVKLEIGTGVDMTKLVPRFEVPKDYTVQVNGVPQVSGVSVVDFTKQVKYEILDLNNHKAEWDVAAVPLSKKILIDASHDGGVWWFPQGASGFNQDLPHQGKAFADMLRSKGYTVDELGRGAKLQEVDFMGYFIVIRAFGFQTYTQDEIDVYVKLIMRGMNMVFFTDHKKYDPVDEIGYLLGLDFRGTANGTITKFTRHTITENLNSLNYIAGSVLINPEENQDLQILGWLGENEFADFDFDGVRDEGEMYAPPVMGVLTYPNTKVFAIGDGNGLEIMPQPFINNLITWMMN